MVGYFTGNLTEDQSARGALALGIVVLVAAPGHRGVHLLGAVAIWLTACEFLSASRTGDFALWRWAVALATLAVIMILTRLPEFRAGARANPWREPGTPVRPAHASVPANVAIAKVVEGQGHWVISKAA